MKKEDKSKLIEVFKGSPWEADLVKSMLADNGVECALKDSLVANVVLPASAVEVSVQVVEADFEAARQVVETYEENRTKGEE